MVDQALARFGVARLPSLIERLQLADRDRSPFETGDQPLAVRAFGPGQRDQALHRRLGGHLTPAQRRLHRLGNHPHQRQAPADPTRRTLQGAGEIEGALAVDLDQFAQHPALLEHRAPAAGFELQAQHQRLRLAHRPHQGVDHVARQGLQRRHPGMAIDQHIAVRDLRHHHHRRLLAVRGNRSREPTLAGRIGEAQRRVLALQFTDLDRRRSRMRL